ncbi:DUF2971 domain-containing protein [Mucilaginibacter sp. HMF5004]|uniref:DUF2971 domain-containing protein n=1 Tax=Mucilaginibacter rivuli TaxID=2857527 RepID=UPI001C5EB0D2|nr:DUF2971 domain-containing protein [Mucilaginibacter rivuli]MBW4888916.1 DUF2971 domain-containing protein [Mucilaginibacter rivuli]
MYRFRPVFALLDGYHELENQEIYFASPKELNDPMEGFRDIYWKGDAIVWENLLVNYVRCVEQIYTMTLIAGDHFKLGIQDIPLYNYPQKDIPEAAIALRKKVKAKFFDNEFINSLSASLANRNQQTRREELLSYLSYVHAYAINAVSQVYHEEGIIPEPVFYQDISEMDMILKKNGDMAELVNNMEETNPEIDRFAEFFFSAMHGTRKGLALLTALGLTEKQSASNAIFLVRDFPEKFIDKLESLCYPDWYSASFLSECTNSAVWGHYGNNHSGVCLIFRAQESDGKLQLALNLGHSFGAGDHTSNYKSQQFREIKYNNCHVAIDFFRSIGRSPAAFLEHNWYRDESGDLSICADYLSVNTDQWRLNYWRSFYEGLTVKLKEWDYEKEYRIVLEGGFIDYSAPEKRKVKYNFEDLTGLIFGIKTTNEDKLKIIHIIQEKCKLSGRTDFEFRQAFYSNKSGLIENYKLSLFNWLDT